MTRQDKGSARQARGRGLAKKRGVGPDRATPKSDVSPRWTLRYSQRILDEDLTEVGHAALAIAREACEKKLAIAPDQYGDPLRKPLHGLYKLKVSHVRIVYHVETTAHELWVLMIGNRRDIWAENQGEILERVEEEQAKASARAAEPRKKTSQRATGKRDQRPRPSK